MYTPHFNELTDRAILLETMRAHPFAILVGPAGGLGQAGAHAATHLPLVVKDEGPHGTLEGHFARANTHWQALAGRETLVIFSGPHSYVSPALYDEQLSVPTWNYIAIHARGELHIIEDETGKEALLESLIQQHEPAYATHWHGLPEGFRRSMLAGIVGFRIRVTHIEGKFKLSQNRPQTDRDRIRAAQAAGTPDEQSLAAWMTRLGL